MSRGLVRQLLKARIQVFAGDHKLSYKGGGDQLKVPAVYQQFVSVENDEEPDAPSFTVRLNTVRSDDNARLGQVQIIGLVYAEDSEQGYRDAENVIEALELYLRADPWLDKGAYKLTGPWESTISDNYMPTFHATLTCNVEMPEPETVLGPGGDSIGDMI